MRSSDRNILLGKLGKPHGVKGFLYIHYYGEDTKNLSNYKGLFLDDGTSVKVERLLLLKNRVILKFHETNSRNDAEKLRDKDLFILAEKEIKRIEKTNEDIKRFKALVKLYDRADIINDIV